MSRSSHALRRSTSRTTSSQRGAIASCRALRDSGRSRPCVGKSAPSKAAVQTSLVQMCPSRTSAADGSVPSQRQHGLAGQHLAAVVRLGDAGHHLDQVVGVVQVVLEQLRCDMHGARLLGVVNPQAQLRVECTPLGAASQCARMSPRLVKALGGAPYDLVKAG